MSSEHIAFTTALWDQPHTLAQAAVSIRASLDAAQLAPWLPGQTVAIISMGASSHSANALVTALTECGVRAVNLTASDLFDAPKGFEPGDHYVIVSESGRSPEPIDVARQLAVGNRIGITNFPGAAISEVIDSAIGLGGFPDSPVYTVGYNATLMAYSALLRAVGHSAAAIDEAAVPSMVADALAGYGQSAGDLALHFAGVGSVDCVGRGYSYTSAAQSALVLREALRIPTAAYETFQYLHGPMEAGKAGTGLVVFGDGRELPMIASQVAAGVKVLLVTAADDAALSAIAHENLKIVRLPDGVERFSRAIAEIVVVQLFAEAAAAERGLTIEDFLYSQNDTKIKLPVQA
ncbi:SIS domain-containing protein [Glaciibacter psychrotolerans]|uniref:Glutamine--fructose-6-phosphate aminotransferase [isomerizing] n=1 Tax=Glaciibacter psychrotolerans TaxID=670054 RepID=A0A7Z0J698_9MICO|nr:SIS domain-containing protein [Leifsonia psychrotolerans]NYJ20001.1 fructoselysine-6-P-deglycase FrlB-like protein [Leifsonia psychrotolerans]